ncbi:ATPase [Lentibacillus amyloliquefaciens]|uniref:ATPase n=1 Tax=Lentibacillus amyloliquefaciens TaxID=1472767 RepID=A0A0U4DSS9_9BACI|nr:ATPase [Lentibacillus amyloliquefaciens]ALX48392.1 ATPase [Lentibacillus amyloliquefaciens]
MNKPFWIPLIASIGTMFLLYLIGDIAGVDFLVFRMSLPYFEISLLPIAFGILVGFISEWIIKSKLNKDIT